MRKIITSLFISTMPSCLIAQNLAPNSSFEDYLDCPTTFMELPAISGPATSVLDWHRPSEATSDYLHSCATGSSSFLSVPTNVFGSQMARTGEAYTGGYCYLGGSEEWDYREYVEAQLATPMVAGHHYFVNYWVSLAEWDAFTAVVAVDQMGAYFSELPESGMGLEALDWLSPQVVSPVGDMYNNIEDWRSVSGVFTAVGGEEWMTIGNFTPLSSINVEPVGGTELSGIAYYYFEDVCVLDMDGPPMASAVYDTFLCEGVSLTLSGRDGMTNYLWNNGSQMEDMVVADSGTFWVKSIDLTTCSLYADTFRIKATKTPLAIDLGNDTLVCRNMPITLDAYAPEFESYRWNTGATSSSIEVGVGGTYYVSAISECYSGADTIIITTPLMPDAQLPKDTILCEGIPMALKSHQPGMIYSWNTGANICCIEVNQPGNYILTVSNICSDSSTDEINIRYSGCENCIMAPNAFSPNGDGLNDQFKILVNCLMKTYRLNIFNRWGQLVYSSAKVGEEWDGTYGGTPADAGVYFYYIEATPVIEQIGKIMKKGDITIIR